MLRLIVRSIGRKHLVAFLTISIPFLGLIAYQIFSSHQSAKAAAATAANNLTLVLESKLNTELEAAERALTAMVEEINPDAMNPANCKKYRAQINHWLKSRVKDVTSASALRYVDLNGDVLYTSKDGESPTNLADRSYFRLLKAHPDHPTVFSEVLVGRFTGLTTMVLAKAIRTRNGEFAGMAVSPLDITALRGIFASIDIGKQGSIALVRLDNGALVLRYPGPLNVDNAPAPNLPLLNQIRSDPTPGTREVVSPVDGVTRLYGYRKIGRFPFYLAAGIADSDYLEAWFSNSVKLGIAAALVLSILAAIFVRLSHSEKRLLRQNEENRALLRNASDGIHILDVDGNLIEASDSFFSMLGYARNELIGKNVRLWDSGLNDGDLKAIIKKQFDNTQRSLFETRHRRKNGQEFDVEVSGMALRVGGIPMIFNSSRDITERRNADQQIRTLNAELETRVAQRTAALESANKELDSFSYTIAHDMRAPVRAINGFGEMLRKAAGASLNQTASGYLDRIINNSHHMSQLIDDLLRFARLSRQSLRVVQFDMSTLAAEVAASFESMRAGRNVKITIQPGMLVNGDPVLIRAALENLIGNAWKYTARKSEARIDFDMEVRDGEPVYAVRDNGIGFDMQYAHKLFAPFQRLHHANDFEGTGIGLATVKKIIDRHGGRAWIESVPDAGTTVYFTLGESA